MSEEVEALLAQAHSLREDHGAEHADLRALCRQWMNWADCGGPRPPYPIPASAVMALLDDYYVMAAAFDVLRVREAQRALNGRGEG